MVPPNKKKYTLIRLHGLFTPWLGPTGKLYTFFCLLTQSLPGYFNSIYCVLPSVLSFVWPRNDPSAQFRLAIGSYMDKYCNVVRIVKKRSRPLDIPNRNNAADIFTICEFSHPYPTTKIQWSPDISHGSYTEELLATSGDYLRIWNLQDDGTGRGTCTAKKLSLFNNVSLLSGNARSLLLHLTDKHFFFL